MSDEDDSQIDSGSDPQIDPRFDPAFQRGFDGTRPQAGAAGAAGAPVARSTVGRSFAPSPSVDGDRDGDSDGDRDGDSDRPASAVPPAQPATLDAVEQSPTPVEESAAGRNPYLIVLGVVAVILVAIGVWLFMQAAAGFNSRAVRSQGDYMSLGATLQVAPFVSLLGVATAIAVVFVFAIRWPRR